VVPAVLDSYIPYYSIHAATTVVTT
jgi:hypothetical protein